MQYKERLFEALALLDDDVIKSVDIINTDFQIYFFAKKYGVPQISADKDIVTFIWKDGVLKVSKRLCAMLESCKVRAGLLTLEGYVVVNNVGIDFADDSFGISLDGSEIKSIVWYKNTTNDKLAFAVMRFNSNFAI